MDSALWPRDWLFTRCYVGELARPKLVDVTISLAGPVPSDYTSYIASDLGDTMRFYVFWDHKHEYFEHVIANSSRLLI